MYWYGLRQTIVSIVLLTGSASAVWSAHHHASAETSASEPADSPTDATPSPDEAKRSAASETDPLEGKIEKASVTEHEIDLDQRTLRYRATAANMPMVDEEGETKANVFFVAYEALEDEATPPEKRPLTFVFNGGPGAAAVWLHLGTAGPKRIDLLEDGQTPPPPHQLVDNKSTWLDQTDLVFIDPVGTGFSRPAKDEKGEQFYGVEKDIRWMGEFIRLYLTHYERWASPLFLAGESYGTTRAAGLSAYLLDRYGITLNGIILISCALDFQLLSGGHSNDLPYSLYLPTYTAAAWYQGRLHEDLQADFDAAINEAKEFALNEYASALLAGNPLNDEQQRTIARKLARLTSLPEETIRRCRLRIEPWFFRKQLLAETEQVIGRFDARIVGFDPQQEVTPWPGHDPSFSRYLAVYSVTFNDYVRRELGYKSTLPYEVLSDKVRPWDYGKEGMGYLSVTEDLTEALIRNPHLKVLFASGYYDLATPFFATDFTINHLNLPQPLRDHLTQTYYKGGHMMYHHRGSLIKLKQDVATFIENATR